MDYFERKTPAKPAATGNPQPPSISCLFEEDNEDYEFTGFVNDLTTCRGGGDQWHTTNASETPFTLSCLAINIQR